MKRIFEVDVEPALFEAVSLNDCTALLLAAGMSGRKQPEVNDVVVISSASDERLRRRITHVWSPHLSHDWAPRYAVICSLAPADDIESVQPAPMPSDEELAALAPGAVSWGPPQTCAQCGRVYATLECMHEGPR